MEDSSLDIKGVVLAGLDLIQCERFPPGAVDGPGWFTTELYNLKEMFMKCFRLSREPTFLEM